MQSNQKNTIPSILSSKGKKKISALTAYDFTFAQLLDLAEIDIILVGDSLSNVVQGNITTLPVTLDEMIYHCRCVTKAVKKALVIGDMPFLTYQVSVDQALQSAGQLLKEGNVSAVKLEGGVSVAHTISKLVAVDIPVMGHVGLTPQSYHRMGGHKFQGRSETGPGSREQILKDAIAVQEAGAFSVVLEGIPEELAKEITAKLSIPTIGIGAGNFCDGQILVLYDLLGLCENSPKFAKPELNLRTEVIEACQRFRQRLDSL